MALDWDAHKETIQRLWRDEGMPLDKVIRIMEADFRFYASKAAYERQLRKWGFQKNIKAPHNKFLKTRLRQREQQGKESHVVVKGVLLPKLEIEKRIARITIPLTEQFELEKCRTPEEITIITPTSDGYMRCVKSRDLPWIYFLGKLPLDRTLNIYIDMPPEVLRAIIPFVGPNTSFPKQIEHSFRYLSATLPVKRDEDVYTILHRIVGSDYASATTEMLKLTVYLLSNKLLSNMYGELICDKLLKWFQMGDNYRILSYILSHKLPTVAAFAEGIFFSALKAQDRKIAKVFLDSGMNPNIKFKSREHWCCTPLKIAANRRNLGLAKLLLKFGADVDLKFHMSHYTPLGDAIFNNDVEMVQFLVQKGATIGPLKDRESPLSQAVLGRYTEIAKILLRRAVDMDLQPNEEIFLLDCAIRVRAASLVEMLLKRGIDINFRAGFLNSTPLESAVMIGDDQMIQRLLQMGADVNFPGWRYGKSALDWAVHNENLQVCQALIKVGADLNSSPQKYWWGDLKSVLATAVSSKNYELVKLFLEHGADVNDTRWSQTALQVAVELNDMTMTQLLLSAKADPALGKPIIFAIYNRNLELVSMLLSAGAIMDAQAYNMELCNAVTSQDSNLIQFLLGKGADPNTKHNPFGKGDSILMMAIKRQDLKIVQLLLEAGADPNTKRNFFGGEEDVLIAAIKRQDLNIVQLLLEAGADPNTKVETNRYGERESALLVAIQSQDLNIVKLLLEAGADSDEGAPLVAAISLNSSELIEILISAGASYNTVCKRGYNFKSFSLSNQINSLQLAALRGNIELVRRFLNAGADLNYPASERYGRTALQAAIESGNLELIQFLIDEGANVNSPAAEVEGVTALQAAVSCRHNVLVRKLLEAGADANDAPARVSGLASLGCAANNGDDDIVCLLIDHGADVNAPAADVRGRTALQAAAEQGHARTVELLLRNGAHINAPTSREDGITALRAAAKRGYLHIADTLLNAGADVNAVSNGYPPTALQAAAYYGRLDMLKLLLNAGADITSKFGRFQLKRALEFATEEGHDAAAKFLKYHQLC